MDREKALRLNIAAQVAQLVEDAADLKAWTVSQVCGLHTDISRAASLHCRYLHSPGARRLRCT